MQKAVIAYLLFANVAFRSRFASFNFASFNFLYEIHLVALLKLYSFLKQDLP